MSETEERIERYEVADCRGREWRTQHNTREAAERVAALYDATYRRYAPHRVVHLVELRPGERVVREEEVRNKATDDGAVWVKVAPELLPSLREWSAPVHIRIVPAPTPGDAANMHVKTYDSAHLDSVITRRTR